MVCIAELSSSVDPTVDGELIWSIAFVVLPRRLPFSLMDGSAKLVPMGLSWSGSAWGSLAEEEMVALVSFRIRSFD